MIQLYRYLILSACLLIAAGAQGQQVTIFNSSITNPYSLNPAKAGESGNQIFIQHRNQWVDIPGSPENTMLTTEWRLSESKVAIGFKMLYDVDNIINNSAGYFTYAYHTPLGGKHHLSTGLSFGLRRNAILFDRIFVQEEGDPLLFGYNQSGTRFDADFGLSYKYDKLELQFSAMQLLGNDASYFNTETEETFEYNYIRHYVASAAYTFNQNKDIEITPMLRARGMQGFNLRPEAIIKAEYQKQLWMAGHYNHNRSAAFSVGVHFQDIYTVSYSAEVSTHKLAAYNGATHEIVFGVKFGNAFDRTNTQRKLEKIQKSTNTYDERLEYLKRENDKLKKQVEEQKQYYNQVQESATNKGYQELKKEIELLKQQQNNVLPKEKVEEEQKELKQMMEKNAGSIEFENGKTVLKESSYDALQEIVEALNAHPEAQIIIEGHTDNTGSDKANLKVSEQRALTVKDFLVEQGVSAEQITVEGKGSTDPKADNSTAEGRRINRRVEIKTLF